MQACFPKECVSMKVDSLFFPASTWATQEKVTWKGTLCPLLILLLYKVAVSTEIKVVK